jgi:hypothetical protein
VADHLGHLDRSLKHTRIRTTLPGFRVERR